MIKSSVSRYWNEILPGNFSWEEAVFHIGTHLYRKDFHDLDEVLDILYPLADAYFEESFRRTFSHKAPDIVEEVLNRIILGADSGDKDMQRVINGNFKIVSEPFQTNLQIAFEGFPIFLFSPESQDMALETSSPRDMYPDGLSSPAFEILLDNQKLSRSFVRAYKEMTGKDVLDGVSLLDASLSIQKKSIYDGDDIYHGFSVTLFTPNGGPVTERSLSIPMKDEAIRTLPLDEAFRVSWVEFSEDTPITETQKTSDLMVPILHLIWKLEAGDLRYGDPVNPQRRLQAQVVDRSRSKRERHALRNLAKQVPDFDITPISLPGESYSVEDILSQMTLKTKVEGWSPVGPAPASVEVASPRDRNPHGKMHPQQIRRAFPWLGLPVSDLRNLSHEARSVIKEVTDREGGDIGCDGILQDRIALNPSPAVMKSIESIVTLFQKDNLLLPRESRVGMEKLQGLLHIHEALETYLRSGSSCFQLNGSVSDLMSQTEIADIQISDLKLPYDGIYLTFDQPPILEVDKEPATFEGAYLTGSESELVFTIITRPEGVGSLTLDTIHNPMVIRLPREHGLSLQDAVLEALETNGYDLDRGEAIAPIPSFQDIAKTFGSELLVPDRTAQDRIVDRNEVHFGSMVEAVTLTANALMLLTEPPEEVHLIERWSGLREKTGRLLTSSSAFDREKGRAEAQQENAMPIRVISLSPDAEKRIRDQKAEIRRSPEEAYWRKGHWRRQPHGPGNSLRRWTWIEPVLCNAEAELKKAGTVYKKDLDMPDPSDGPDM